MLDLAALRRTLREGSAAFRAALVGRARRARGVRVNEFGITDVVMHIAIAATGWPRPAARAAPTKT